MASWEWSDEDLEDNEFPDEEDDLDDDRSELTLCPHCGADIYEDSEQCPSCGQYITFSSDLLAGRPTWWVVLGLLGIAAAMIMLAWM